MKFNSEVRVRGEFKSDWSIDVIKNEPMFFGANLSFAYENGGPMTRAVIDALPQDWIDSDPVMLSRVHQLAVGWYPAVPGYHHDDIPAPITNNQSSPSGRNYSEHLLCLVNGEICPTSFINDVVEVTDFESNDQVFNTKKVYNTWDREIESNKELQRFELPSGKMAEYDNHTFHSCTSAVKNGWRWLIRFSRYNDGRPKVFSNEIRRQTQIYMDNPRQSW